MLACAAICLALTACQSSPDPTQPGTAEVPAGAGPLPTDAIVWAVGDTIHVNERSIRVGKVVRAMVEANGRIYFIQGRSEVVRVTGGGPPRRTGLRTDGLSVSDDDRYLGMVDESEGEPWSTVIIDLESGELVLRDDFGMGDADDDFGVLYGEMDPRVLGFVGDELFVRTAADVTSWDARTGARTAHKDPYPYYFARPDPGGGQALPGVVRRGRLVVPQDPYRSTQPGHVSPDGSVAVMPVDGHSQVFDVRTGRRLPANLHGRKFILGAWTSPEEAYGLAVDRSAFGPRRVRLVACRLTVEERSCRVLRTIRPPEGGLVLFPTGSRATDY